MPCRRYSRPLHARASTSIKKSFFVKGKDCRVKPGNDEGKSISSIGGIIQLA